MIWLFIHHYNTLIQSTILIIPSWSLPEAEALLADRADDAQERVRDILAQKECEAVIPSKSNRKEPKRHDKELYKARHLIENFFAKLKQYRAIATPYDKTDRNFLGAIYLAASLVWLNWRHSLANLMITN